MLLIVADQQSIFDECVEAPTSLFIETSSRLSSGELKENTDSLKILRSTCSTKPKPELTDEEKMDMERLVTRHRILRGLSQMSSASPRIHDAVGGFSALSVQYRGTQDNPPPRPELEELIDKLLDRAWMSVKADHAWRSFQIGKGVMTSEDIEKSVASEWMRDEVVAATANPWLTDEEQRKWARGILRSVYNVAIPAIAKSEASGSGVN